jgi:hypothetical protein
MAAPVDVSTLIYSDLWSVLNANANFATVFTPSNQIRYDQGQQTGENYFLSPGKTTWAAADFPQIEITLDGGTFDSFKADTKTFAQEQATYNLWMDEDDITRFKIAVISQDQRYATSGANTTPGSNQLQAIIMDALRQSGPKLGLNYLLGWGPITWERRLSRGNGMLLNEDTMRMPVKSRFQGNAGVLTVP